MDAVARGLAAAVGATEEEAHDGEGGAEDLGWDVPVGFAKLFDSDVSLCAILTDRFCVKRKGLRQRLRRWGR